MRAKLKRRIPQEKFEDPGKTLTPVIVGQCTFDRKLIEIAEESVLGDMTVREAVFVTRHQLVRLIDHVTEPLNPKLAAVIDAVNRLSPAETYMVGACGLDDAIRAYRGFAANTKEKA